MSEIIKATVVGAAGRMGSQIVQAINRTEGIKLVGAIEAREYPTGQTVPETEVPFTLSGCGESESLFQKSDVIIDVSDPKVTMKHIILALKKKKPLVIGTTSLSVETTDYLGEANLEMPCVLAPNFSVGVNLLFKLVEEVTAILGDDYDVEISEVHHRFKKDAPSGTAKRLAEIIARVRGVSLDEQARYGRQGIIGERTPEEIGIHVQRIGDVVGEHTVSFGTIGERFELTHKAHSRDAFAKGAVRAAMWIVKKKPGLYDMQDVLGLR